MYLCTSALRPVCSLRLVPAASTFSLALYPRTPRIQSAEYCVWTNRLGKAMSDITHRNKRERQRPHEELRPGFLLEVMRSITVPSRLLVPLDGTRSSKPVHAMAAQVTGDVNQRFWFESKPFTSQSTIDRLVSLRLSAYCQHQGWFTHRAHASWFDIAILSASDTVSSPGSLAKDPASENTTGKKRFGKAASD